MFQCFHTNVAYIVKYLTLNKKQKKVQILKNWQY